MLLLPPNIQLNELESPLMASQKSGSKDLDVKIESFLYEEAISFNVPALSSFALMIDESIKFAKQNPLQTDKHCLKLSVDKAYE